MVQSLPPATGSPTEPTKLGHGLPIVGTRDARVADGNAVPSGRAQATVQRQTVTPNLFRLGHPIMPDVAEEFLIAMPQVNKANAKHGSPGFLWPSLS